MVLHDGGQLPVNDESKGDPYFCSLASPRTLQGGDDYLVLLLVAHGLEDIAVKYLVEHDLVPSLASMALLPRPDVPAIGDASLDKLLVRLSAGLSEAELRESLARLQAVPVVQAVLAFVAAAEGLHSWGGWEEKEMHEQLGDKQAMMESAPLLPEQRWPALRQQYRAVPTGILEQLAQLVGSSVHWPMAEEILRATGVGPIRRFRASCVTSGCKNSGFDCTDAMKVVGGGALAAHAFGDGPVWKVDLKRFEVEVYGFVFHNTFACGLLLGGQWRRNTNEDKYSFSKAPSGERASRPYTIGDHQPWFMPRLRPSTAMLLLQFAELQPGDKLLDPMGGCGTIAIEAAVRFQGVHAITSDNNSLVTSAAIKNCVLARPHLADGSNIKAEDWDARCLERLEDESIDRVVTDMPFGNRCRWNVAEDLPAILGEMARVLRPEGKAVLLTKGYRRIEAILSGDQMRQDIDEFSADSDCEEEEDEEDLAQIHEDSTPAGLDNTAGACAEVGIYRTKKGTIRGRRTVPVSANSSALATQTVAEGSSGLSKSKTSCRIVRDLAILNRRQVSVGGYLCYAIILGKRKV